jgi:predicted phage terminase large subunit-like protein
MTKYIPHTPTAKQQLFLLINDLEAFYGGAAGGGKSDALLMAALQYVDVPGYSAIILRDTFQNLNMPDSLIPRAMNWLLGTDAQIREEGKRWIFPSGAILTFGYLSGPRDHFNYQSAAFQFVGIDEVVNIRENQALYMYSRLRKKTGVNVPLRFRCASNPPAREQLAIGAWVKKRYIDPYTKEKDAIFISAKLQDNPYLNHESYIESLMNLDPITRKQLLDGDWNIKAKGRMFQREWFPIISELPNDIIGSVRYWDLAATEPSKENKEPCYTTGCRLVKTKLNQYRMASMIRERREPLYIEQLVRQTAQMDGKGTHIYMEQEPGASGKSTISHYRRNVLPEFLFSGDKVSGSKYERAMPVASQAEAGNIALLAGHWNESFLDEVELFPDGQFLDQVDALSGAYNKIATPYQGGVRMTLV